jgi:hypothetical protein
MRDRSPLMLEPGCDFFRVEAQEPTELKVWDDTLLGPQIDRRRPDFKPFRERFDSQQSHAH